MSENDGSPMIRDVEEFLRSCGSDYEFPTGGSYDLPTSAEDALLRVLIVGRFDERAIASDLQEKITRGDSYSLVIFAVRMAILSARLSDSMPLQCSLWAISADKGEVDWRDVLVALAIIEDCAKRIGFDLSSSLRKLADCASERRKHTILEGYLARDSEMRSVETFGYSAIDGEDGKLGYCRTF